MKSLSVFVALIFIPNALNPSLYLNSLVVWNVGQGQWITWVTNEGCRHFDFGGEFFPKKVMETCRNKQNQLALTHWDFDHLSFSSQVLRSFPNTCLLSLPSGQHKIRSKLKHLKPCTKNNKIKIHLASEDNPFTNSKNDQSSIFILMEQILITGDLGGDQERKRISKEMVKSIRVYLAGHHGSITSSSSSLLNKLNTLDQVLVSARERKYGHPHWKVLAKFRAKKTPVLRTEDWGHISLEF